MYLSCIQTAVVYLVWCFTVDPLFCRIPAASLSRCVLCLPVEWGAMVWLQALLWDLATVKVPSRIGPFWYFPSPFMVCFLLVFYFDILIYKNRYYLLADVYLFSSCFFWMPGESFCFVFSFFNLEGSPVFLYGDFLYAFFVCCAFVFPMESVNLSDHLWFKSTLTFSFSDALKRKICFSCVCFFLICASFAWVGGWFVPDIVWLLFT